MSIELAVNVVVITLVFFGVVSIAAADTWKRDEGEAVGDGGTSSCDGCCGRELATVREYGEF